MTGESSPIRMKRKTMIKIKYVTMTTRKRPILDDFAHFLWFEGPRDH
jgi:hypothetical protein